MGALPSSRLTRILQEKAEALKKRRQTAEALEKEAEESVGQLERLGIGLPEVGGRVTQLRELARRSDWDTVEIQSKALLDYLATHVPGAIEDRRRKTVETVTRMVAAGIAVTPENQVELAALAHPAPDAPWSDTLTRLVRLEDTLNQAGLQNVETARREALAIADWAQLSEARRAEFTDQIERALGLALEGRVPDSLAAVSTLLRDGLPEAKSRHDAARTRAEEWVKLAKEHGASTATLEEALRVDVNVGPERWPTTIPPIDTAVRELGEALRERSAQVLATLRTALDTLTEYGTDATSARAAVDEAIARLPTVPSDEIPHLLETARTAAEEPIVAVVAALLDEVRPRISEARRLGRDPSEVFAAMNRAREALRLKIYSEALAASQEAAERVGQLTEDLEAARDELQTLEEMLARFHKSGFLPDEFDSALTRVRGHLDRVEVGPARDLLRETVVRLGREALRFFHERYETLDRVREYAQEHGFLSEDAARRLTDARERLDAGDLATGAEELSQAEVELRNGAVPYVARRVEEMEQGLADIPDDSLTAPVRRLLADADVTLRVKQDLLGAVESLRKAERDFASVFAVHASALVDLLEEERRILENMGGPGDEIQRQIDEVQQIFNMGDFVKASRASQEIRTRAQQQQLLRSEESVSHAKLSLVELETLGLDLGRFRGELEDAQAAARAGHYAEAYRLSHALEETAVRTRAETQAIVEEIALAQETLGNLRELGVDPEPFYEPIRGARLAFQALDLGSAKATIQAVRQKLAEATAAAETDRLFGEIDRLLEDGRRLSAPMEPFANRLHALRTERATAPAEATRTATRLLHEELVSLLAPILEENLRGLERDLDIARGAGVDLEKILAPLAEARRRIALPVPLGAAALLDAARAEFIGTRGLIEHAERVAKRAREALAQADLLRVEVGPLRAAIEQVDAALGKREYARAIELGGPIEREVLQATYHQVSKTLAGFRAMVSRLRNEGVDTTIAENLLHQARMALDEGRPVDAVQLASKSEAELERVELQRQIAEGSIEAAERSLVRETKDGVVAPAAVTELDMARGLFQRHQYADVLEHAITASDTLVLLRESHRRARDACATANAQVAEATELGAEVTEASGRMTEGLRHLEAGHYPEAIRAAREATEMGRWAIERLFAGPLGRLRGLIDVGRHEGLTTEVDPVEGVVAEAEAALRAREWHHVREAVTRGESAGRKVFAGVLEVRWRELEAELARAPPRPPGESPRLPEVRRQIEELTARQDFGAALGLVRTEREAVRHARRERLENNLRRLKEQLWVGERLGVETTPMMQTFSEARVSLDAGRLEEAETQFGRGTEALESAIREPFVRRRAELLTEVNFAAEGLRVSVGPLRTRFAEIEPIEKAGRYLEAARIVLALEEELNLRKSLHRELMNLHYLIDAALSRAAERRVDTSEARALLTESIRLREQDYPAALEKARDALRRLQGDVPAPPTTPAPPPAESPPAAAPAESTSSPAPSSSTPFWPFRRPPG